MSDLKRQVEDVEKAKRQLEGDRERRQELRKELKTGPSTLRSRLSESLTRLRQASR